MRRIGTIFFNMFLCVSVLLRSILYHLLRVLNKSLLNIRIVYSMKKELIQIIILNFADIGSTQKDTFEDKLLRFKAVCYYSAL